MPNFSIVNTTFAVATAGNSQAAVTTTYKSQITMGNSTTPTNPNFTGGGLRRGKLYDILVGTNGTPADNYMEWDVERITSGTSTFAVAITAGGLSSVSSALELDLADAYGAVNGILINSSLETTFSSGAEVFYVGVNQRASYRWVAAPGSEIVWPANTSATGNNGLSGRVRSAAYTGTATMQWLVME